MSFVHLRTVKTSVSAENYGRFYAAPSIGVVLPTLSDLLQAKTDDEIEAQLLAVLNAGGFPVTDYTAGSPSRTILKMIRAGLKDKSDLVPTIAAGGFLGLSSAEWLELLADQNYLIQKAAATPARQSCRLTCEPGTGPYTRAAGELVAKAASGRLYRNVGAVTVPSGNFVDAIFEAEAPGSSYNSDGAGSINVLVTPLPGLSITNPEQKFGGVDTSGRAVRAGSGTGTITPSAASTPSPSRSFRIKVTASANGTGSGTIQIDVTVENVTTTTLVTPIPASYASGDVTLTFANGPANTVSWLAGDVYTFTTPGSPLVIQGTDAETDESLRSRCRGRWPALSAIPTSDRYESWITQASLDGGYGISKIKTTPSDEIAGVVNVYVAGATGAPAGAVITALQAYVDARDGITDRAIIWAAANKLINVGGTVIVRVANAAAVKAAARSNWEAYLAALPIGGDTPDGVVRLAELQQAIMDAGAVDVSGLTLNAAAANVSLLDTEVAVKGNDLDTALTFLEVP